MIGLSVFGAGIFLKEVYDVDNMRKGGCMIDKNKAPQIFPVYADNGEHSHFKLIDVETGETLWEEPEESMCDSVQPQLADVRAMAQEVINWQNRFNEAIDELEKATGIKKFRVGIKSIDDTLLFFMPKEK